MIIEQADKSQLNQLLLIANHAFGDSFITKPDFEKYINDKNRYLFVCILNNEVAGFITASAKSKNDFIGNLLHKIDIPDNISTIGWIEQVAVHPNFYRKGIANKMLTEVNQHLSSLCNGIYCISWVKGVTTPMSNLLIKNNFTLQCSITNYWSNDSLSKQYDCMICGAPPCTCSAEFYCLHAS